MENVAISTGAGLYRTFRSKASKVDLSRIGGLGPPEEIRKEGGPADAHSSIAGRFIDLRRSLKPGSQLA